ncbi:FAD-dependent oxidoreductase [Halalkalibacter sp. APA_J-10(15)]|uniref:FAD-dependent oxidoreductase n=1 Tax=Halalkalibacter sp. APA_J-10(15) TaxID=2933805 RepID=UPI001FF19DCA|nr:FAD-dependent oxidoreductase [Halalkalibacter sp. APA_J-10(15)]MCK0470027.1 FAD-dependent oxidoreductase [Halalkalibacter sp. APA_J-10(15)]
MRYVIIGGDAAGMSAAMQIVRHDENAEIITLERGEIYSYAQCGLPYVIGGLISSTTDLIARDVETFRHKYRIDARTKHEVTSVDLKNQIVSGVDFSLSYDKLLLATGASPIVPSWPGNDLEGIHTVKTIPDTEQLMADAKEKKHITIIGGGYIGLELAENFIKIGKDVTIIEQATQLAASFDEDFSNMILEEAEKNGINVRLHGTVEGFSGNERVERVITDQASIRTNLVVVAIGVTPNTSFLSNSDLHFHRNGAVIVNRFMETNVENVYAAGDCATQYHRIKQKNDYIPLGTHANKQGRLAGKAMIGQPTPFQGIVGTSIIKFFSLTLGRTGLSSRELEELSYPYNQMTTEIGHIAGYYPGAERLTVRLCYHRETNQLLGGQIIGHAGVDKRIDVLSTALYNEMKIDELEHLDLAYAPPYNSVWDPIQQTARRRE